MRGLNLNERGGDVIGATVNISVDMFGKVATTAIAKQLKSNNCVNIELKVVLTLI